MQLSVRIVRAFEMACRFHNGQFRKGSEIPYLSHLMVVSGTVLDAGGNEDAAIAALLHDAVEDHGGAETLQLIASEFGNNVARIVRECSDTLTLPKPPWKERKLAYLDHLVSVNNDVLLVSLADKIHNSLTILRGYHEIGEAVWKRFREDPDEVLWYYRSLVSTFQNVQANATLLRELDQIVSTLESLRNVDKATGTQN